MKTPTTNMTGAELQTLRESCHLSREELADLANVEARTLKHWENGRGGVPADVADLVQQLEHAVTNGSAAVLHALQLYGTLQSSPAPLALARFKTPADVAAARTYYLTSGVDSTAVLALSTLPPGIHAAIAARAGQALRHMERVLRVVWFDAASFNAWHTANPGAMACAWAQEQVTQQAKPHRADQPPTGL